MDLSTTESLCAELKNLDISNSECVPAKRIVKITSLPVEIILRILTFSQRRDLDKLKFVSLHFAKACRLLPFISTKDILIRLFMGDFHPLYNIYLTNDSSIALLIDDCLALSCVKSFEIDPVLMGRYALMRAISSEFLKESKFEGDFEDLRELLGILIHPEIKETGLSSSCLRHATSDIITFLTPRKDPYKRFHIALAFKNFEAADSLLEEILRDFMYAHTDFTKLEETLDKDSGAMLEFLFMKRPFQKTPEYFLYKKVLLSSKNFSLVVLDAFLNGHLDLDLWYHQLIGWIYLSRSSFAFKKFFMDPRSNLDRWHPFAIHFCLEYSDNATVRFVLQDSRVDPSLANNEALMYSIKYEDEVLMPYLINHPKVDVTAQNFRAFWLTAMSSLVHIMKLLLERGNIDPGFMDNELCKLAAESGELEMMKFLIADPRVDPTADRNKPFKRAAQSDHVAAMKLLLTYPGVDPFVDENEPFKRAAEHGAIQSLDFLLNELGVDPSIGGLEAFQRAVDCGHVNAMNWLLQNTSIDPSVNDNQILIDAVSFEDPQYHAICALLKDPRVDPSAQENQAFVICFEMTYPGLELSSVDPTTYPYSTMAPVLSHALIGRTLLRDSRVKQKLEQMYPGRDMFGLRGSVFQREFLESD